jgi:hypothetical protein
MSKDCRADKKVTIQKKFPDACAAGGRGDPCTQCKEKKSQNGEDAILL